MAKRLVSQVVETCCPEVEVPNPVRRDVGEVARTIRYGTFTGKYSMQTIIKNENQGLLQVAEEVV